MFNQLRTTLSVFLLMLTGVLFLAGCGATNPEKTVANANERAVKVVKKAVEKPEPVILATNDEAQVKVMHAGLKSNEAHNPGSCGVDTCNLPPALKKRMMLFKQKQAQLKAETNAL